MSDIPSGGRDTGPNEESLEGARKNYLPIEVTKLAIGVLDAIPISRKAIAHRT
jgi:hypothetical protein